MDERQESRAGSPSNLRACRSYRHKAVAPEALADIETVVTGHYPAVLTMADLKTYGIFMRELVRAVQAAKGAGRSLDDFVRNWKIPEPFVKEGYVSFEHLRPVRADFEVIWNETG